jgi:hypothetical protein
MQPNHLVLEQSVSVCARGMIGPTGNSFLFTCYWFSWRRELALSLQDVLLGFPLLWNPEDGNWSIRRLPQMTMIGFFRRSLRAGKNLGPLEYQDDGEFMRKWRGSIAGTSRSARDYLNQSPRQRLTDVRVLFAREILLLAFWLSLSVERIGGQERI